MREQILNNVTPSIKGILKILYREKGILLGIIFSCILISTWISSNMPVMYQTSSSVRLDAPGWNSPNFIELLNKRDILKKVKLRTADDSNNQFKNREISLVSKPGTTIIEVVVKSENAADAKKLADESANELLTVFKKEQYDENEEKLTTFSLQMQAAKDDLRKAENEMSKFYNGKNAIESDLDYIVLRDDLNIAKENYIGMQSHVNEYKLKLLYESHMELINEASLPDMPINQSKKSAVGIGLILGLLISIGYILFSTKGL